MKKTNFAVLGLVIAALSGQAFAADAPKEEGKHHKRGHHLEAADVNKDGTITREEFHAQGDKMFNKMDKNSDGKFSADEREAMKKEWAAKRAEWKAKREAAKGDAPVVEKQ